MVKLNEKSKNVFLYSKDGSKNDTAVKAFQALKAALGNTALTAENFKQFAAGFQEFIKASSVQAAPAADDEDPNTAQQQGEQQTNKAESDNTNAEAQTQNTETQASGTGQASGDTQAETPAQKNIAEARKKPSSLLFANN